MDAKEREEGFFSGIPPILPDSRQFAFIRGSNTAAY
jgi:hypothetical protein